MMYNRNIYCVTILVLMLKIKCQKFLKSLKIERIWVNNLINFLFNKLLSNSSKNLFISLTVKLIEIS